MAEQTQNDETNVNFLVTGMHRSGTSAVAAALGAAGIAVGDEDALMKASVDNPSGFFERRDTFELNERLLSSLGWTWDGPDPLPPATPSDQTWFTDEARAHIDRNLAQAGSWLIKDPRISILLPWWRRVLLDRFVVIVLVRSPVEVAWSLALRDGMPIATGLALWAAHYRHLTAGLIGLPAVTVRYEALTREPGKVIPKMLVALAALADAQPFDVDAAIATIRPELRRPTHPAALTGAQDSPGVRALLDAWSVDDVSSVEHFSPKAPAPEPEQWEVDALVSQRRVRMAWNSVRDLQRSVDEEAAKAASLQTALNERSETIGRLDSALAVAQTEADRLAKTLTEVIAEKDASIDRLAAAISEVEGQRDSARRDLSDLTAQRASADQAADRTKSELTRVTASFERTRNEFQARTTEALILGGRLDAARREADVLRLEVVAARRRPWHDPTSSVRRWAFKAVSRLPFGWTNPLVDRDWYLARYPDVRAANKSPSRHYRQHGAREGRDPNPMFETLWYLAQNPDVATNGLNPLDHYLRFGGFEGRDPSPMFDSDWYLETNPDVRSLSINPLLHYLRHGVREGRSPRPLAEVHDESVKPDWPVAEASSAFPRPARVDEEPSTEVERPSTVGSLQRLMRWKPPGSGLPSVRPVRLRTLRFGPGVDVTPSGLDGFDLICLTHIAPWPPRAGNEHRFNRVLDWLRRQGWRLLLVYCPPAGEKPDDRALGQLLAAYPDTIVVLRDGTIQHGLPSSPVSAALDALDGRLTRDFSSSLGDNEVGQGDRLVGTLRDICPDALVEVADALNVAIKPRLIYVNYVFMTRALQLFDEGATKVVDTHDVFSTKQQKGVEMGVDDGLAMSPAQETILLRRADLVIAVHPDEAAMLRSLAPSVPVVTVGLEHLVSENVSPEPGPTVLLVGSSNPFNVRGARDFLRLAWPRVRRAVPGAELRIVGPIGDALPALEPGVVVLGRVEDLEPEYARARVVINPTAAGTGLKIKTVEALAHLRPLVAWPLGIDGLDPELAAMVRVVTDWVAFTEAVITLLADNHEIERLGQLRPTVERILSPESVYAEFAEALPVPEGART